MCDIIATSACQMLPTFTIEVKHDEIRLKLRYLARLTPPHPIPIV